MIKMPLISIFSLFLCLITQASIADHHASADPGSKSTYNYVELNQMGNPADVLEVKEGMSEELTEGQARVEVLAAPIHPSNLLQIAGNYLTDPVLPSTPGSEGVGRVTEVASGVTQLKRGQLVLLGGMGTWREEIVAPAARLIPLPDMGKIRFNLFER